MAAIIRTLIDIGYSGPIRPDHGRRIWNENVPRTGYGLYDRAMGSMYLYGLWQGIEEERKMHTQS
jgi:mannonate dehydratase